MRSASDSSAPSEPSGLVLWSILCCSDWASASSCRLSIRGKVKVMVFPIEGQRPIFPSGY